MITCVFCKKILLTVRGYVLHCRVHRNEPRCIFRCVGANCSQTFSTYSAFKGHFYRVHNAPAPQAAPEPVVADLKCAVSLCALMCVMCTSHMCRKHKACSPDSIDAMYRETRPQPPNVMDSSTDNSENTAMPSTSSAIDIPENDSQSYLRNMCLFYLKGLSLRSLHRHEIGGADNLAAMEA